MTFDFSDFDKGFKHITAKASGPEVGKGLFKAANELLNDAKTVEPKAPFDEGTLHGASQVNKAEVTRGEASVEAGFNIEYAARWHELTPAEDAKINWSLPGSGRKYLESKMVTLKEKYMEIVAEHIRNVMRRG